MEHVSIDTLDAIELTEILEYLLERLDVLDAHDLTRLLFADNSPYELDDLRADITRLVDRLQVAPFTP